MLKYRAISFPLLLGLFFLIVFGGQVGFYLFVAAGALMIYGVTFELGKLAGLVDFPSYRKVTAGIVTFLFLLISLNDSIDWLFRHFEIYRRVWLLGLLLSYGIFLLSALGWFLLVVAKDKGGHLRRALGSAGVGLVSILTFFPLLLIYLYDQGPMLLLFLVLATKMMDTGGYIFGMLSGRLLPGGNHKLLPAISPKKSWEGTIGGLVFSVATAAIFWHASNFFASRGLFWCLAMGALLGVGSLAGDLTESALKRAAGVKDSGNYIPGMGGIFDVLDSFIYNGLLFLLIINFS